MSQSYSKKHAEFANEVGRLQPQACELEEAILGALMLEEDAYETVSEILTPQNFYSKTNELIFSAIHDLAMKHESIDVLTVVEQLKRNGALEEVGGVSHLAQLSQKVVSGAHLKYHARIIAQKAVARQLISFSSKITGKAFDETIPVDELIQEAEANLFEISQKNFKKDFFRVKEIVEDVLDVIRKTHQSPEKTGLRSGFKELDDITFGWQNSDLIIIAARPSMGKTAFALSMLKNMAVHAAHPVAFFSLEMSSIQLVYRLIVNSAEIEAEKIRSGKMESYEWKQLETRIKFLCEAPIYIDETPSLSIFELRSKARRLVKKHQVKCIFIDYLQLMNAEGTKFRSREQEVSIISRSLKGLAKELNIPIIALSQLNRNIENRLLEAKRPQLSDLRESGAIEQDADIVCFIHRPEKYEILEDAYGNDLRGKAEIIIAKHRNGSTGNIILSFKKEYIRFQNLEENHSPQKYISRFNKGELTGSKEHNNLESSPFDLPF